MSDIKNLIWTAVCKYPDKEEFLFYSPDFSVERWADLDTEAEKAVAEAWAKISPYPAPPIVDMKPGYLGLLPDDGRRVSRRGEAGS